MLSLLLDIHIKPVVATQVLRARPACSIASLLRWHDGMYRTATDAEILEAAHRDAMTLVTYDQRTIPLLLRAWAQRGKSHAGVIFVDGRTMRTDDVGSQVRSLITLWDAHQHEDWTNMVHYLRMDEQPNPSAVPRA
jgi:predicted nuclease of predicted toxin-antitoxin system